MKTVYIISIQFRTGIQISRGKLKKFNSRENKIRSNGTRWKVALKIAQHGILLPRAKVVFKSWPSLPKSLILNRNVHLLPF